MGRTSNTLAGLSAIALAQTRVLAVIALELETAIGANWAILHTLKVEAVLLLVVTLVVGILRRGIAFGLLVLQSLSASTPAHKSGIHRTAYPSKCKAESGCCRQGRRVLHLSLSIKRGLRSR